MKCMRAWKRRTGVAGYARDEDLAVRGAGHVNAGGRGGGGAGGRL